jgi:hypothetical protein
MGGTMKVFLLPEQLGNAVLQYLGRQPYLDVAPLVAGLMALKEAQPMPLSIVPKAEDPKA